MVQRSRTGIVGQVKRTADLIAEITAASQEQAQGIEQVNKALIQKESGAQADPRRHGDG